MIDGLNEQQRAAVEWSGGPLIVLAGPGTGKTRVIIARIARLIEGGADPRTIMGLTFSVKAAEEMRSRLAAAVAPRAAEAVTLSTFHAFGRGIIARFGDFVGLSPAPTIMDSARVKRLLRRIVRELNLFPELLASGREPVLDRLAGFVSQCRNAAKSPAEARACGEAWVKRAAANEAGLEGDALEAERLRARAFEQASRAFERFDAECARLGLATFDDFLAQPIRILREKPQPGVFLRDEIRHIVVDEFQDVNPAQLELLRALAPPSTTPDLCVVGDDDQAIYSFRGADTHAFSRFASIWAGAETIPLTTSHRCAPPILAAANAVIRRAASRFAPDKTIEAAPDAPRGSAEGVLLAKKRKEGEIIAAMILADRAANADRAWSSYAVLARTNTVRDEVAAALEVDGIPVDLRRPSSPLDDAAVLDLLAWARLIVDPSSVIDARRLLLRPPMNAPLDAVTAWEHEWGALRAESPAYGEFLEGRDHESARRLAYLLRELRGRAALAPADAMIEEIIRRAGLARAESLTIAGRAARVEALAAVLAFARDRQAHLDPPGDLSEFLSYYADLDEKDRLFRVKGDESLDSSGGEAGERSGGIDAVTVLTAHSAKGLEFDTVFVARVRPGGFPGKDQNRAPPIEIPVGFRTAGAHEPDERGDEERRLFYVACTRAKRRLVLLAEERKTISKSIDYFNELTRETPGLELPVTEDEAWLKQAAAARDGEAGPPPETEEAPEPVAPASRRRALLDRAARRAHHQALAALHDATRPGTDEAALASIESRLVESARALAAIARLDAEGAIPPEFRAPEWARRIASLLDRPEAATLAARRPEPPLELSYSHLTDYEACPRCYYVKYLLRLDEPRSAELTLGTIAHEALNRFMAEFTRAESEADRPDALPGRERLLAIGEEAYRRHAALAGNGDDELRARLMAQLGLYWEKLHDPTAQTIELERAFTILHPRGGHAHRLKGKVDRIDRLADGRFRIVDYKTGRARSELSKPERSDPQMAIYAMALPSIVGGERDADDAPGRSGEPPAAHPGTAEYWILSTGERGVIDLSNLDLDNVRQRLDAMIDGLLAGRFEKEARHERTCKGLCWLFDEAALTV